MNSAFLVNFLQIFVIIDVSEPNEMETENMNETIGFVHVAIAGGAFGAICIAISMLVEHRREYANATKRITQGQLTAMYEIARSAFKHGVVRAKVNKLLLDLFDSGHEYRNTILALKQCIVNYDIIRKYKGPLFTNDDISYITKPLNVLVSQEYQDKYKMCKQTYEKLLRKHGSSAYFKEMAAAYFKAETKVCLDYLREHDSYAAAQFALDLD